MHSIPRHVPYSKPPLPTKSPIISPDLEKGRGSLDLPLIVRDAPDEIPLSTQASKPNLNPESRDSPGNPARQQMTSLDSGVLATRPHDARAVERILILLRNRPIFTP